MLIEVKTSELEARKGFFGESLEHAGLGKGKGFVSDGEPPERLRVVVLGMGDGKDVQLRGPTVTKLEVELE